jgi:hypothetical protein
VVDKVATPAASATMLGEPFTKKVTLPVGVPPGGTALTVAVHRIACDAPEGLSEEASEVLLAVSVTCGAMPGDVLAVLSVVAGPKLERTAAVNAARTSRVKNATCSGRWFVRMGLPRRFRAIASGGRRDRRWGRPGMGGRWRVERRNQLRHQAGDEESKS